jgi:hypothetical protein
MTLEAVSACENDFLQLMRRLRLDRMTEHGIAPRSTECQSRMRTTWPLSPDGERLYLGADQ